MILAGILHKYQYGSYHRGLIKQKYKIKGYVQDHHIIPRQFRSRVSLDLDNSNNIIILPTSYGKLFLDTRRKNIAIIRKKEIYFKFFKYKKYFRY